MENSQEAGTAASSRLDGTEVHSKEEASPPAAPSSAAIVAENAVQKKDEDEAPISARRAKAMSIGNAASLFGAPADDGTGAALFGSLGDASSSKPSFMAQSPFDAIGEEAEEPAPQQVKSNAASLGAQKAAKSPIAESPNDTAAALFGDGGQSPVEWLGGGTSTSANAASNDDASNLFASVTSQQQQQGQDPSLYASGQFGDAQYAYDHAGTTMAGSYGYPQSQTQYANQPQAYGQYEEAAVDNFNQNIYYDPAQQQQYQQSLQAQAHLQQQQQQHIPPALPNGQSAVGYQQQPYAQYGSQYAPADSQSQYAAYYAQQPQSQADNQSQYAPYGQAQYPYDLQQQQQQQQQPASAYQSQDYLQAQQVYQTPYSAPAATTQSNQFSQSQSQSSKTHYAPAYSQMYDPYAPSSDPYATQNVYNQPSTSSGHVKQPSLTGSSTSPNLAASMQASSQQPGKKDPKLNRSASSFFAELPPMPAKSRPASAAGGRTAATAAPPVPPLPHAQSQQQVMLPPPPKAKSPAPATNTYQRPPSRVKSAQPPADYGGWSPSMSHPSQSRPGSRTAQRQGSLGSAGSYGSQPGPARSSFDQAASYGQDPYDQGSHQHYPAYDAYSHQAAPTQSMSSRQPVENNPSQYQYDQQYNQSSPYGQPSQIASQSQSRPQSRTGSIGYASPSTMQATALPPAKRVASRPMAARTASSSSSGRAMSPKQQVSQSVKSSPAARATNQLGLTEDDTMEELMDSFSRQRIHEGHPQSASIASEESFNRATKTPLPASEPDTEPRILSPPQSTFKELDRSGGAQGNSQTALSPSTAGIPLLSVSLPSPEVDRKPSLAPSEDDTTDSDMREVDEELTRAEQEIKLEDEDMEQKPSQEDLRDSQAWQKSQTDNSTYTHGTSPYEDTNDHEEQKPSQTDLRQAWQSEETDNPYGQSAPPEDAGTTSQGTWQQETYGQYAAYDPGYGQQPQAQVTPDAQYAAYQSYGAYDQPSHGVVNAYNEGYSQQEASISTPQVYGYAAHDQQPSASSFEDPSATYDAYNPDVTASNSMYQGNSNAGSMNHDRPRNRPAVPIASFGFNGKFVTFFPSSNVPAAASYGMMYDQSSSVGPVKIQKLSEVVPSDYAGLDSFPGPLFMDTGSTSASGKTKKKKELVAWLNARIEDSQKERGYLGSNSSEELVAQADQKTLILQLLKILLEHDGKLTGTPQIDQLVQQALVPHLSLAQQNTFAVAADLGKQIQETSSAPLSQATTGDLDTIQAHLLKGEKKEAVQYALNNRLYTHALIIASGTDKALLGEVVKDFLAFELGGQNGGGREALKVAYSFLAGSGPACINEFVPASKALPNGHSIGQNTSGLLTDAYGPPASRAPSPLGQVDYPKDIPPRTLSKWQETAAMIIANRTIGDSQALTSLGDVLLANAWYKAAHACFLLSPLTATLGGPSVPGVRWSLLGAHNPLQDPTAANDLEAIMLTEILEFAYSLVPVPKGQEAYIGLPHLQAYRVLHACNLAEAGHHARAQKYCDAIGATLKLATKRSPFYHPTLLAQVKELSDRLSMVSFQDKTGSWISRKVQRPTIDNVWSTLESRFAKFVTGEGEEDPAEEERKRKARDAAKGVAGPFAHYSSITPQGPESLSRNGSYADLTMRVTPPPQPTSVPNTVSHAPTTKATHHRRSSSYAYGPYGADPYGSYVPQMPQTTEEPEQPSQEQGNDAQPSQAQDSYGEPQYGYVTPQNDSGWWSNANGGQETSPYGSSSSYGQAPTFSPVTEGFGSSDAQGLMSPMGFNQSPNMASQNFQPQPSKLQQEVSARDEFDDDDDLGLGNSSTRRRKEMEGAAANGSAEQNQTDADKKVEPAKKEEPARPAASTSGSWLGRIFRREGSASPTTGPVRAKLGEESAFVYDPVEKRWVNKKAGSDTPPPAATPPPPRAQTASPAGYSQPSAPAKSGTPPPPSARSVSATAAAAPPPARSTPPPPSTTSTSLPGPPPPGSATSSLSSRPPSRAASVPTGELPPPPARKAGGSAAAKKARSRYVDVLAQEQK